MKLVTYMKEDRQSLGLKTERGVLDVEAASALWPAEPGTPSTVMEAIRGGKRAIELLERLRVKAEQAADGAVWLREEDLEWGPSVTHPNKIICIGLNYRKHAEETGSPIPDHPILFNKFNNTLTANKRDVAIPGVTDKVDYEAELAVVIGSRAKYVTKESALDYVFGYSCVNDLSARDLQMRTSQWLTGKSCDDFSPLGPYLVTADEVGNPNDLEIRAYVNGEIRQQSNTADMIFHVDELVSYVSRYMTLEPGDILLTGTPEGVVMGYPPEKQVYLKPGDLVKIEIEGLGSLENRMTAEFSAEESIPSTVGGRNPE
ncbi:fumarylacetoacetate hydrolase family protein [Cohnella faecalis]|uniref:FAA hydrolase family protein n=1 Tax=Cohnella faecalis TaxID=2315694 RepID=A0A398CKE1_9BACL|nr:fumarylacetoacetate hydrolase family protein [Cohnella faecalis]RIE00357.1 FAA hydrolase family protein [Cohnella faecalis]